jgi:multidrug efflux system membrane fusion protein
MISAQVDAQPTNTPRKVLDVHGEPVAPHTRPAGCGVAGIIVAVVVLAALAVGGYFGVTRLLHPAAAAAGGRGRGGGGPVPVVIAPVTKGDMSLYLNGLGTVTAYNTVTLRTRVDGQIMAIHFTEGQMVKEGQLLIEIDPRPYQVQLAQAQGTLQRDQAQLTNAKLDLQRFLSIPNSVTQQQIDQQKAMVAADEGTVVSDQSQVDNAKLNLVYCNITAPISGRIGLRLVDIGNMVHASDSAGLLVITQLQPIAMVFTVSEDQITEVLQRPDHGAGLPVDAYNRDMTAVLTKGKLLAIDNQVDPATGTVKIKAEFANDDGSLFPNEFVNAKLLVNSLKGVTIVPAAAVQLGPQNSFVYVVRGDNTVELRTVKIGPREGNQEVVEEGLAPGERVVTDGIDKLTQGTKVMPHTAGGGAGASTRPAGTGGGNAPGGRAGRSGGKAGATTRPASVPAAAREVSSAASSLSLSRYAGRGQGEGLPRDAALSMYDNRAVNPHPIPLPEYRERENVGVALANGGSDLGGVH